MFFSIFSFGQNNEQKEFLVCYSQVWGFLKYFHPEPSKKEWDKYLIEDYEKLLTCNSRLEFNQIISDLINECGSYKSKKRVITDSLIFKESFSWLNSGLISKNNHSYLTQLRNNKPKFKNKYISKAPSGNPKIINENSYGNYGCNPSIHYLSITRYWNIINYFCPNRNIIPENWNQVLKNNLHNFITANNYKDYYFAVRKMTTEIRDGHGFIRTQNNPIDKYKYAPFYCIGLSDGYFINVVLQDSLQSIDLKRMDRIISINGEPIEHKIRQVGNFLSSSNDYYLSKATRYLGSTNQDSITLAINRDGNLVTRTYSTIDRVTLNSKFKSTKSNVIKRPYIFLKDSISGKEYCYIDMGRLKSSDINREFKRKLMSKDYLIVDSRNYPNWTLIKLSKLLINGRTKFAKFINMDLDYPGSFKWTESQTVGNKMKAYEGKVYVLVDYNTMSQAEYTVMAFQQHPNTIVIGGQTAGSNGNVSEIPLPFGIKSFFSGLGVFYPDGTPSQQVGIKRDYNVLQNSSYLQGKDLILEKALELIRNK